MNSLSRNLSSAVLLLALVAGCKSREAKTPATEPTTPVAPIAAEPITPSPTPAASEATAPTGSNPQAGKRLRDHLARAAEAKVNRVVLGASGAGRELLRQLDAAGTAEYLTKVGLDQTYDGPVVRCPNDLEVVLSDASGTLLGVIGYCGDNARFDLPDGTFGGIKAPRP